MKKYYYSDGSEQLGPFTFEELKRENITKDNLVWFAPMEDWRPAREIKELDPLFSSFDISKSKYEEEVISSTQAEKAQPKIESAGESKNLSHNDLLDTNTRTPKRPTTYLWQSIVVLIVLCNILSLGFAIAGVVNAAKVNSAYDRGEYAAAERASKMAKTWTTVAFIIGLLNWIVQLSIIFANY